jgi:flagellar biosynthesis/type III secretory pathway protein FliH
MSLGRSILGQERRRSRQRALHYAALVKSRGFSKGYQEGLASAHRECAATLEALRNCYEGALALAAKDTHTLAVHLAERIVDRALMQHPEILFAWIEHCLGILRRSRTLQLSFKPQYEEVMLHVTQQLPPGLVVRSDASLTKADFIISGDNGDIEFAWRKALEEPCASNPF